MAPDDLKICEYHMELIKEIAKIHTTQDHMVKRQDEVISSLEQVKTALSDAKLIAAKDLAIIVAEREKDRTKVKPVYWVIAVFAIAIISETVRWLHRWWVTQIGK